MTPRIQNERKESAPMFDLSHPPMIHLILKQIPTPQVRVLGDYLELL